MPPCFAASCWALPFFESSVHPISLLLSMIGFAYFARTISSAIWDDKLRMRRQRMRTHAA